MCSGMVPPRTADPCDDWAQIFQLVVIVQEETDTGDVLSNTPNRKKSTLEQPAGTEDATARTERECRNIEPIRA